MTAGTSARGHVKKLAFDELKPFVAPVLLQAKDAIAGEPLLKSIIAVATKEANASRSPRKRAVTATSDIDKEGDCWFQALTYEEQAPPSWTSAAVPTDVANGLIVVAVRQTWIALYASDGAMRDRLVKKLDNTRRVSRDRIATFVGPEAKAVWLNGVHTPTAVKADTKAMTGVTLEYAIDPIGDQTYYYSAARTTPDIPALKKNNRPALVGAAPGNARIWVRRSDDWTDFKVLAEVIFDHVEKGKAAPDPFSSLAQSVADAAGVLPAYALTILPQDLLSEDDIGPQERERSRRWAYEANYEIEPLDELSIAVTPTLFGMTLGRVKLTVKLDDQQINIQGEWEGALGGTEHLRDECMEILCDVEKIKIYYESGHTVAQGRLYIGGFSDQPFGWDFQSFDTYELDREKPDVPAGSSLAAQIAQPGDKSLFAYVCQKMFLDAAGNPEGWLASDDGSMELADFIHIDPVKKVVTLVHVKASKSKKPDRQAAPADFEIVVSQAVKNLRHLDRRRLAEELKRGRAKKIGAAVWHNGMKQPDRDGFVKLAEALHEPVSKVLIVLQPRLTKREVDYARGPNAAKMRSLAIKQIDTLMLAAQISAAACGARFVGIADVG
ncbi:hypothetical protein ACC755_09755 [Rhizobium ruizarguesonis]|uniref:hypothetical protein n=1 Tax=Rhizobium ruizarguesonis TaxID=2081791 RepID=UPI0010318530|nr:hypothetical protein [Rhizobium ruizarguesonis]TAY84519.1 hypothetical protein ELH85_32340 [Rhizobium ruizarguesonis]